MRSLLIALALTASAAGAYMLTPTISVFEQRPTFALDQLVPRQFGDWQAVDSGLAVAELSVKRDTTADAVLYDASLMRSYRRASDGAVIMLALAYGKEQRQDLKLHRPELCYYSQGFQVLGKRPTALDVGLAKPVNAWQLLTRSAHRVEPVTYWMRVGDGIVNNATESRLRIMREGLGGRIPDGLLVRVSSALAVDSNEVVANAYDVQQAFLRDMLNAIPANQKSLFAGELAAGPAS